MNLKALVTPLALVAGLTLGTSAIAQTTVGGVSVSEEDLPDVQRQCEDLADARANMESSDSADPTPQEEVVVDGVDLSSLSISDCEEAGLLDDYEPNDTMNDSN